MASFFANYGYHLTMGIKSSKVIYKTATTQRSRLRIKDVDKFANKMSQFHKFLHKEMTTPKTFVPNNRLKN